MAKEHAFVTASDSARGLYATAENGNASSTPRSASLALHVLVIGGGWTGLAAAYAIRKAGHTVHVLEAQPGLVTDYESAAAYMPPNLWHILDEWGLHDKLMELACPVAGMTMKSSSSGDTLFHMRWHESMVEDAGEGMYRILRSDLRNVMYELAISAGVEVSFNSKAVGVNLDGPCVILESGEVLDADLIVGADGAEGAVRRTVMNACANGQSTNARNMRGLIPLEALRAEPLFDDLLGNEMITWMDAGRLAFLVPAGSKPFLQVQCLWSNVIDQRLSQPSRSLSLREQALHAHSDCEPQLRRAIQLMQYSEEVNERYHEPLAEWTHETGRLVCVGNACHPLASNAGQDCALAAEDAVVLGSFLSRIATVEQLPYLLEAYEEVRQFRCETVVSRELIMTTTMFGYGDSTHAPQHAASPDVLRESWTEGQYDWQDGAPTLLHDARGEAELWWQHWGKLLGGPRADFYSTEESDLDLPSSRLSSRKPSVVVECTVDIQHVGDDE